MRCGSWGAEGKTGSVRPVRRIVQETSKEVTGASISVKATAGEWRGGESF